MISSALNSNSLTQTISYILGGTSNLTWPWAGSILTLSGTNTYTGGTTITAGTILLSNNSGLGTGTVNIGASSGTDSAELRIGSTIIPTNTIVIPAGSSGVSMLKDMTVALPHSTLTQTITLNKDLTLSNNGVTQGDHFLGLTGNITGTGNLTITGGLGGNTNVNRVALSATNTFIGNITINANSVLQGGTATSYPSTANITVNGVLQMGVGGVTQSFDGLSGTGSIIATLAGGWSLSIGNNNGGGTFSGTFIAISSTPGVIKNGTGTQIFTGVNNIFSIGVNAGILQLGNGGAGTIIPVGTPITIAAGAQCIYNTSGTITQTGTTIPTGTGKFTVAGTGNYRMNGTQNTATGTYEVTGGDMRLILAVTSSASAKYVVTSPGRLMGDSLGITYNLGELSGNGDITNGGGLNMTYSIGALNTSTTFSGPVGATGTSLIKVGTGTLTLTGAGTFSGITTITTGILQLGDGLTTIPVIPLANAIVNNATLIINTAGTLAARTGVISGTGAVNKTGTGTLTLSGLNTYSGTTVINAGLVNSSSATALGTTGAITVNSGGTLTCTVNNTSTKTVTVNLGGTLNKGGFALAGWTISGAGTINP